MKVKFLQKVYGIKVGEVKDLDPFHAKSLVRDGVCEEVKEAAEVKPKK